MAIWYVIGFDDVGQPALQVNQKTTGGSGGGGPQQ